jgi:hypothetical protein
MKKTLFFLFALMLCWSTTFAAERGIKRVEIKTKSGETVGLYEESHALVIGVSDYTAGWPDLESVTDDIKAVSQALEKHNFHVVQVLNPTKKKLTAAFDDFIDNYGFEKNNRLLFYFSGHGHTKKVFNQNKGYLVPSDAPIPYQDSQGFYQKAIGMTQIHAWAKQIEAKHALFVFDSCFSGSVLKYRALKASPQIQALTANPVRLFITAGTDKQIVPAQSVFRYSFTRGIRGDADLDKDGYITGTELGLYIRKEVTNYDTGQTPQFDKMKDPLYDAGDFVFVTSKAISEQKSTNSTSAQAIIKIYAEKEMWEDIKDSENIEYINDFLSAFPNSELTPVAKLKLKRLNRQQMEHKVKNNLDEHVLYIRKVDGKWGWYLEGNEKTDSKYLGETENSKPSGQGTRTWPIGDKYVGEFKDGGFHGLGTFTWDNGDKYTGDYTDGKRHGKGLFTYTKGDEYIGEWKDDKMRGQGTYTSHNGNKYFGGWKDNLPNGQGTFTWSDGKRRIGEFRRGEPWNITVYDKNRNIAGKFVNGVRISELETKLDKLTEKKPEVLRQKLKAEAKTKKPEKQGVLYLRQVRNEWDWYLLHEEDFLGKYVGGIKNGKPNGQGKLTYVKWKQKGEKYEGEWKDGEKHGKGTRTLPDGRKYEGEWRLNKPWNTKNYDKYGNISNNFLKGVLTVEKKTIPSIPLSKPKEESKNKSTSLVDIIRNKSKTTKLSTPKFSRPLNPPVWKLPEIMQPALQKVPSIPQVQPSDKLGTNLRKIFPDKIKFDESLPDFGIPEQADKTKLKEIPDSVNLRRKKLAQLAGEEYNLHIRTRIIPKLGSYSSELYVRMRLKIIPTGKIIDYEFINKSGFAAFDKAAELAVRNALLDPLPKALAENPPYIVWIRIQAPHN